MIAFWVKALFFALSLTGLISSWIVLYAFGRVVGQQWAPMLLCAGSTILQIIFCLGMIYKMDPFRMPRSFCIAQTLCIGLGAYLMAGAAAALSVATSLAVLKPKTWRDGGRSLQWRSLYLYPTVVFPVVATIIHTTFVFKFNSVHPTDDLHCDSSNPEWVRFLSYAGLLFIPGLPSLYLSIRSVRIIYKTYRHLQRSRTDSDGFSQSGRTIRDKNFRISRSPLITTMAQLSADPHSREQIVPAISSHGLSSRQFHLPFTTSPLPNERSESCQVSVQEIGTDDRDSSISMSFPTFTRKDDRPTEQSDDWRAKINGKEGVGRPPSSILAELPKARTDDSIKKKDWTVGEDGAELDCEDSGGDVTMSDGPHDHPVPVTLSKPRPPPNLAPAVWRLIIFQFAFVSVQFLACISTVIDVATHRPTPTPFGTQHIALLLTAWGPTIVFGHLPAVMRNLRPWRELNT